MKRLSLVALIVIIFLISSCTISPLTSYSVIKNFNNYPSRNTIIQDYGEEIVGVLLKYTSEGAYNSNVKPISNTSFHIYCLFDNHGFNGDGMEFNYVLYVPEDIRNQYIKGGGEYPKSGNPFWWYLMAYFPDSYIEWNWESVIEFLCNETELPLANSTDYIEGY